MAAARAEAGEESEMKVSLCDRCGEKIDMNAGFLSERGRVAIYIALGPVDVDGQWQEYHRGCARNLTIAQVYNRKGARPL
jgi:hypothetical protein